MVGAVLLVSLVEQHSTWIKKKLHNYYLERRQTRRTHTRCMARMRFTQKEMRQEMLRAVCVCVYLSQRGGEAGVN